MGKVYSIFEVFAYKGGELIPELNLTEQEVIESLIERVVPFEIPDLEGLSELLAFLSTFEIKVLTYAGNNESGICARIYEHFEGKLKEVEVKFFVPKIKEILIKNLVERPLRRKFEMDYIESQCMRCWLGEYTNEETEGEWQKFLRLNS